jgi:hypothetical protein
MLKVTKDDRPYLQLNGGKGLMTLGLDHTGNQEMHLA